MVGGKNFDSVKPKKHEQNNYFADDSARLSIHPLLPFILGLLAGVILCLLAAHGSG